MSEIRTFHARRGRMTEAKIEAMHTLLPVYGVPGGPSDPARLESLLGGRAVVVEIGFGLGHATVAMAEAEPDVGIVAIDVHTPGVARLLVELRDRGIDNVRVVHGDAVAFLRDRVAPASLSGIRAFFPDPWPRARHHKRRLVRPDLVALMASRLAPTALLHVATDWAPYAEEMVEVLDAEPLLVNAYDGPAPRGERPLTRYELAGLDKGHEVVDLVYARV
jgi:tRNA (guanine-N7-)-methyltransferase